LNTNPLDITPEKLELNAKRSLTDRMLVLNDNKKQTFKKLNTPFGEFINDGQFNIVTNLPKNKHFITSQNWDDYINTNIQNHDVYKDIQKQVIHEKQKKKNETDNNINYNLDWKDVKRLIKQYYDKKEIKNMIRSKSNLGENL